MKFRPYLIFNIEKGFSYLLRTQFIFLLWCIEQKNLSLIPSLDVFYTFFYDCQRFSISSLCALVHSYSMYTNTHMDFNHPNLARIKY